MTFLVVVTAYCMWNPVELHGGNEECTKHEYIHENTTRSTCFYAMKVTAMHWLDKAGFCGFLISNWKCFRHLG